MFLYSSCIKHIVERIDNTYLLKLIVTGHTHIVNYLIDLITKLLSILYGHSVNDGQHVNSITYRIDQMSIMVKRLIL